MGTVQAGTSAVLLPTLPRFGDERPHHWHATDGAEMGKMMVSEGMGPTLLPDYSVAGDPCETSGQITCGPSPGTAPR